MDNKRTDGSQSGRSMVEMLGVLAIIGVLSIGGIAGYSRAMIKFKVGKSLDQISMLVASIQTLYSGQRNYSGLTLKEAISYGVISPDMKASDSTVTNVFAGSVLLGEAKYRETAGAAFQIVYNGLGQEACVTMASSDWGTGSSAGPDRHAGFRSGTGTGRNGRRNLHRHGPADYHFRSGCQMHLPRGSNLCHRLVFPVTNSLSFNLS